jgi:hypothetical protein
MTTKQAPACSQSTACVYWQIPHASPHSAAFAIASDLCGGTGSLDFESHPATCCMVRGMASDLPLSVAIRCIWLLVTIKLRIERPYISRVKMSVGSGHFDTIRLKGCFGIMLSLNIRQADESHQGGRCCENDARIILKRRTSSTCQIFQPLLIVRPNRLPPINVEAAVIRLHHIFNGRRPSWGRGRATSSN